jgi:lipopolysaccharide export LptBFGC system permease protein LptF
VGAGVKERLPGTVVLSVARRVLSRRAVEGIVIPVLADLQHEHGQAAGRLSRHRVLFRGYAGLAAALLLHAAAAPGRLVQRDWADADAPGRRLARLLVPRAAVVLLGATVVLLAQLVVLAGRWRVGARTVPHTALLLLVPGTLAITIPAGLFLGLVLSLRRLAAGSRSPREWLSSSSVLSGIAAAVVFTVCGWLGPTLNQSFREVAYRALAFPPPGTAGPDKGIRELTFGELTARRGQVGADAPSTRALGVEWHKKLALPVACLALGPVAVGLAGRRRRLAGELATAVGVLGVSFVSLAYGERSVVAGRTPPWLGMWGAALVPALAAVILLAWRPASGHSPRGESPRA